MQREVIVGTLLGDASMSVRNGKPRFCVQFEQTIVRANYIHHLYDLFDHFVGTKPKVRDNRQSGRQCIRFQTPPRVQIL